MELDRLFLLCDAGAPEAEALVRLGLHEGQANTHPGQGTACRRFFFGDAYLELLWVYDEREVRSIEHEFEAHVHHEQVAPQDDAQHTEAEEHGADDEIMFEADVHHEALNR